MYDLYRWLRPKHSLKERENYSCRDSLTGTYNMYACFLGLFVTFRTAISTAVEKSRSIGGSRNNHGLEFTKIDGLVLSLLYYLPRTAAQSHRVVTSKIVSELQREGRCTQWMFESTHNIMPKKMAIL